MSTKNPTPLDIVQIRIDDCQKAIVEKTQELEDARKTRSIQRPYSGNAHKRTRHEKELQQYLDMMLDSLSLNLAMRARLIKIMMAESQTAFDKLH